MADDRPSTPRDAYGRNYDHSTYGTDGVGHHSDAKGQEIGSSSRDSYGREHYRDGTGSEIRDTHK